MSVILYLKCDLSVESERVFRRCNGDTLIDGRDKTTSAVVPLVHVSLWTTQHDHVQPVRVEFFERRLCELGRLLRVYNVHSCYTYILVVVVIIIIIIMDLSKCLFSVSVERL